jgi:hypothetical protein
MTMDEVTLLKTISQMCESQMVNRRNRYVFITVDFSKWCSTQTWASVTRVFKEFDNLFGLDRVFTYTQLFPIESLLLYQSRYHPPNQDQSGLPLESSTSTHRNNKWLEGLRQKGWTLVTLCMILYVAMAEETTATLLGQGDNQVIVLKIPSSDVLQRRGQTVQEYVKGFLDHLTVMSLRMGMIIKPEETWTSTCLFEYSKKYHIRGTQVSCGLKRASRISSEANDSMRTLNGELSSFYSAGVALASEDREPMSAFFLSTFLATSLPVNSRDSL